MQCNTSSAAQTATQPDVVTLAQFFRTLYGAVESGWLVLSTPDPTHLTRQRTPALSEAFLAGVNAEGAWKQGGTMFSKHLWYTIEPLYPSPVPHLWRCAMAADPATVPIVLALDVPMSLIEGLVRHHLLASLTANGHARPNGQTRHLEEKEAPAPVLPSSAGAP